MIQQNHRLSTPTAQLVKLSHQRCRVCHGSITVHQEVRGGVCSRPSCHTENIQQQIADAKRLLEERRQRLAADYRDRQLPRGILPGHNRMETAILPAMRRGVRPLPRRRRTEFLHHLRQAIQDALSSGNVVTTDVLPEDEQPGATQFRAEGHLANTGCATCRGFCCRLGGIHALLDGITVRRHLASRPPMRPRTIERAYTTHLPRISVEDSCVYHGARGCTLPREMRAQICNTFHCVELQRLTSLAESAPQQPLFLVAVDDHRAVRSKVFAPHSTTARCKTKPIHDDPEATPVVLK